MKIIPILFKIIQIFHETFIWKEKNIYSFEFLSSRVPRLPVIAIFTIMRKPKSNSNPISLVPRNFTRQQFQVEEIGLIFMGWDKGSWFKFLMRRACISVDSAPFCRGLGKLLRYFGVKSPAGISRIMWWKLKLRNAYFKSRLI